jgi:hypothetical protein
MLTKYSIDELASMMLFAKIGWCVEYKGAEAPKDRGGYTRAYQDGWEKFNFKTLPDGCCYGYLVPAGGASLPACDPRTGWSVIFVAPFEGSGELCPVGFYVNTKLESEYIVRPEYSDDPTFARDARNEQYCYCLTAHNSDVCLIQARNRDVHYPSLPAKHFSSAPFRYGSSEGDSISRMYHSLGKQILEVGLKIEWPVGE